MTPKHTQDNTSKYPPEKFSQQGDAHSTMKPLNPSPDAVTPSPHENRDNTTNDNSATPNSPSSPPLSQETTRLSSSSWLKRNKWQVGALLSVVLLCVAFILTPSTYPEIAIISLQGEVVHRVDLSTVTEEYEWVYEGEDGQYNRVVIGPQQIAVSSANCPDQICVLQGTSQGDGRPIICLPHQLTITFEMSDPKGENYDAITG